VEDDRKGLKLSGVSATTWKWAVNEGPKIEGRVSVSTCGAESTVK